MKFIFPKRIVLSDGAKNAQALLNEKTLQIGLNETDLCEMPGGSSIILDFGKELVGAVRIICFISGGSKKIRVRLGESVGESSSEIGIFNSTNDHSARDQEFLIPCYSDQTFNSSGFRFVRLDVPSDAAFSLKSVVVRDDSLDKEFEGSFKCDDERLNEIFEAAAYTVKLCVQNGMVWDGVKRDRLVWIGDLHPEQTSLNCLYSDASFVKNSLKFAQEQTPLPLWMNTISTYSLWWIINLRDYYYKTGDLEFVSSMKNYLIGLLAQIDECVKENGETTFPFSLIDWPSHPETEKDSVKIKDEQIGVHAVTVWAMRLAKDLLAALGEPIDKVDTTLVKLSKISHTVEKFKQISALRLVAGIGDDKDCALILKDGAKGMSTFMSYYILKSVTDRGYGAEALKMTKDFYGKMLDLGATTFWEDFDLEWAKNASRIDEIPEEGKVNVHAEKGAFCYVGYRHSLCHGWSSGPVAFLIRSIAGINDTSIGGREISIKPNLCGLKKIDVAYPTACGVVNVRIRDVDGKTTVEYDAPEGVKVKVL